MSRRTLVNPDVLTATLYQPNGTFSHIPYEPTIEDHAAMRVALREARIAMDEGNPAIGAVLQFNYDGQTQTFSGHSTEITDANLDTHAEYNCYQEAQPLIGRDLSTVAATVTSEPCGGCLNRFIQGHLGKLIYGASYAQGAELGYFRPRELSLHERLLDAGRTILVVSGFMADEALAIMKESNKVH